MGFLSEILDSAFSVSEAIRIKFRKLFVRIWGPMEAMLFISNCLVDQLLDIGVSINASIYLYNYFEWLTAVFIKWKVISEAFSSKEAFQY